MKALIITVIVFVFIQINLNYAKDSTDNSFVDNNSNCLIIDNYLSNLEKTKNFSGALLIIQNGNKLFYKGYGYADKEKKINFTPNTLASMGSITKAFTATAILKLVDENKLNLKDPLSKFFPNVPKDKSNITIHQLLTHSSGFPLYLNNDGGDYYKIDKEEYLKNVFSETLLFENGKKAIYSNINMSILAIIIEKVTNMEYTDYLKKYLFEPNDIYGISYHYPLNSNDNIAIGYQNGVKWGTIAQHINDAGGGLYWNLKGNGGLEATLDDMFKWCNAISNNKILNEKTTQMMFTPQIIEDGYNGLSYFGYGCNIGKTKRNTKLIDNGGSNNIYFARLIRLPEEGLIFYMVTNESTINTNMVLPNVTQLYFNGKIEYDAMENKNQFENEVSKTLFKLLEQDNIIDLESELKNKNILIDDDMILYEVGEKLINDKKTEKALILFKYYTKHFPKIIVAWNCLGDIYKTKGNKKEAINFYKQALVLRPGNPRAIENLKLLETKNE